MSNQSASHQPEDAWPHRKAPAAALPESNSDNTGVDLFVPLSRKEFARAWTASKRGSEYWFAKSMFMKWDDEGKEEARHLLDQLRNDPENYTQGMFQQAREIHCKNVLASLPSNDDENRPLASSYGHSGLELPSTSARSSMENVRTDGILVETPKQAKTLDNDTPYTPAQHRLSTVHEVSGDEGGVALPSPMSEQIVGYNDVLGFDPNPMNEHTDFGGDEYEYDGDEYVIEGDEVIQEQCGMMGARAKSFRY